MPAPGGGVPAPGMPGGDPPQTATAAGGTHPTGMHSCLGLIFYRAHDPSPPPGSATEF